MSYCKVAPGHPWHGPYHDSEYGFPKTETPAAKGPVLGSIEHITSQRVEIPSVVFSA